MSALVGAPGIRRCHMALNAYHSTVYFTGMVEQRLAARGVEDPMAAYLAGRAAAMGSVTPGVVSAVFYSFHPDMVAQHLPAVWALVAPTEVLQERLHAADATLRLFLSEDDLGAQDLRRAAETATAMVAAGDRGGRPMFSAHVDVPPSASPHLRLWAAATALREHRGDSHVVALRAAGLSGLDALVSHCASAGGMPPEFVRDKRGWLQSAWSASEQRLADRGILDSEGNLTGEGVRVRADVEAETDRLDAVPYASVGEDEVAELTACVEKWVGQAEAAGLFPPVITHLFVPVPAG